MSAPYIVTRPLVTNGSLSPPAQGGGVRFDSALPPDPIHCLPVEIKAKSGYLHDTLQQIDDLANEDVEMQVRSLFLERLTGSPMAAGTNIRAGCIRRCRYQYPIAPF